MNRYTTDPSWEDRLRGCLDRTGAGYFFLDPEGMYRLVNPAWLDMHGYDAPEDIVGRHFSVTQCPDDLSRACHLLEKVLQGEAVTGINGTRLLRDGTVGHHICSANPVMENGEIVGCEGFLIDTASLQKGLFEQVDRYRAVMQTVHEGIVLKSANGHILTWNKGAEEILGIPAEEAIGQTSEGKAWPLVREDGSLYDGNEHPSVRTLMTGKAIFNEIMGVHRPDGDLRWISINTRPLCYHGQKNPYAVVISFSDITDIKKEKDLSQMYLDVAGTIILALDSSGTITLINKKGSAILGFPEHELIGKNWFDQCLPPDAIGEVKGLFESLMRGDLECTEYVEEHVLIKGGGHRLIAWNNTLIRDDKGMIVGTLSSGEDITERKAAEKQLKDLTQTLSQAQRVTKIGSWWFDPETLRPVWTDEVYRIFGLEPGGPVPSYEDHRRYIHPEDWDMFDRAVTRAAKDGVSYDLELRIVRPDGTMCYANTRCEAEVEGNGEIARLVGTVQDITVRKQAEQDAHAMAERLDMATRAAKLGIWDWDVATNTLVWDDGMLRLYGMDGKDFTHDYDSWANSLHPDDREELVRFADQVLKGEREFDTEFRVVWPDGTVRHIKGLGQVFWDAKGKPLRMTGINYDITEKRELESRVQQSQKMEAIGNLAGGIAHDFNNILSPIVGMAELLLEDLAHGSMEYDNAKEIFRAGKRGRDLVQQILAFSRQSENVLKPVRVQRILAEVCSLTRATIPANIEVIQDIQDDCGLMMADPTHIHQVAMNLITNAFHAVEKNGGSISIALREMELMENDVKDLALSPGRYALLSVSDTGCGIPSHVLSKIFDPYFTTKESGKGTGLGLAVVYGIVKEHNGDITVDSEEGKGAAFHVYLPLMEKTPVVEMAPPPLEQPSGHEHVLIVDDEEVIVRMERQVLERLGYKVSSRVSSIEALAAFKASPDAFDVVISDMSMPHMTGVQLAREMHEVRPDIPIIVCTGFSESITPESARGMGIRGLLMKPVVRSELTGLLRKVLDEQGSGR